MPQTPETEPQPIDRTVEQLLESVIFADPDPRIQRLKGIWHEAKREAAELLTAADRENYETRLKYHRTCAAEKPEERAKADASVLRILTLEEYDERLAEIWADITRRVKAVLADMKEGREGE